MSKEAPRPTEAQQLQNEAWTIFNAAFHEPRVIAQGLRETGRALLNQSVAPQKDALFAKLDAQNREIDIQLRLRDVRQSLAAEAVGAHHG